MNENNKIAFAILTVAIVLGLTGDLLLRSIPWGLNLLLWISLIGISSLSLLYWQRLRAPQNEQWLIVGGLILALSFVWRDSFTLNFLAFCGVICALGLSAARAGIDWLYKSGCFAYLARWILSAIQSIFGVPQLILFDIDWQNIPRSQWSGKMTSVLKGLILAVPLLVVFGALLASADAVFDGLIRKVVNLNFDIIISHIFLICLFAGLTGGYLRVLLFGKEISLPNTRPAILSLGIIEIGMVLGLINLLFLTFVIIQIRYLFGGASMIGTISGLNYAEYARRGFFELVGVSTLVLPCLLAADWLLRRDNAINTKIFNILAGIQIALLSVIMISAVQRMRIYQMEYGLTELRFYTMAFMFWLAAIFVWFIVTVLRSKREKFTFGVLVSAFALLLMLHIVNPDAWIARTNIARAQAGKSFDAYYLSSLSADAVPEVLNALPNMNISDQHTVANNLILHGSEHSTKDWRSWNYPRYRAQSLVDANYSYLLSLTTTQR